MKWTPELLNQAKSLRSSGLAYPAIAKKIGKQINTYISASSVNHALNDFERGKYKFDKSPDGKEDFQSKADYDENGNINNLNFSLKFADFQHRSKKTPKDILKFGGYKPSEWTLSNVINNDWSVTNSDGLTMWNHQIKFSAKPKTQSDLSTDDLIKLFNEKIEPIKLIKSPISSDRNLVVVCSDFHFGWTHYEDVIKQQQELLELIHRGWKQIWIVQLNDLIHSDDFETSKTTAGTLIDHVDYRQSIFDAEKFMFPILEAGYQRSKEFHYRAFLGNHDEDSSIGFNEMLRFKYPDMDIPDHVDFRNAFLVGKSVGIFAMHGNYAKPKTSELFAQEYPLIWAKSTFRMALLGHRHTIEQADQIGVLVNQVSTFKPKDQYEYKNGFVGNTRKMEVIEFSDTDLKDIHYI
ncbi:hypothetical protein [Oenococcus sicerae]|uniref:Calcineurin-like phosphoesterase domain-containing protein n=1 Tax=Oenococcus sicerae TaxID=2203724 RepID=A0AAJ1RCN5_9LACO|nr:hypothetical protein [Oenococcus sicerae]MDN6899561.1 hypothetical protein [Oenococcus sicerae]